MSAAIALMSYAGIATAAAKLPSDTTQIKIIEMGTGTGADLTIDGRRLNPGCGVVYRIKEGRYNAIHIKNIKSTDGCAVRVENTGLIEVGLMTLADLDGVVVSGDGSPSARKGFQFKDNSYRAIQLFGAIDNVTLQHMSFINIADFVIFYDTDRLYDGTAASISKNLRFLHMDCENTGSFLVINGSVKQGNFYGFVQGIEIAHLHFKNSAYVGQVVYLGNAEDYDIHHNIVTDINSDRTNHNGVYHLMGHGKFYNNKTTNHQGNVVRAWLYGVTKRGVVEIFNNIAYNSTRYGAFELQVPEAMYREFRDFLPSDAKIYNNTVGRLNTGIPKYFEGRLLDLYNIGGGTVEIFNNLSFDLRDDVLINNMSDTPILRNEGNKYIHSTREAVENTQTFKSKITGIGAQ